MFKVISGVQAGSKVTKRIKRSNRMERYIYKDCEKHFEKVTSSLHKDLDLKLLISGVDTSKKIKVKKCQDILLLILSQSFIKEFMEEESMVKINYLEKDKLIYENSIKKLVNDYFLVSKYSLNKQSYIFNIYAIKSTKSKILKYCQNLT